VSCNLFNLKFLAITNSQITRSVNTLILRKIRQENITRKDIVPNRHS